MSVASDRYEENMPSEMQKREKRVDGSECKEEGGKRERKM